MATTNNFWSNLLKSVAAIGLTYAANKCVNSSTTSWVPYRNEVISTAITDAATALTATDNATTAATTTENSTVAGAGQ